MIEKNYTKLPRYLQTETNKKFLSATIDQLLSKRNSEKLNGYIGRRVGGFYDPVDDYYINERSRGRMNYQLEPIGVSKNPNTLDDSNEVFYEDFLNYIKFYNGNISNHDRLFETEYYSFAPPIDMDKFINYQNYYWIPNLKNIKAIKLPGYSEVEIDNIIGQNVYSTTSFGSGLIATYETNSNLITNDSLVNDPSEISINIINGGQNYTNSFSYTIKDSINGSFDVEFQVINGVVVGAVVSNITGTIMSGQSNVSIYILPEINLSSGMFIEFTGPNVGKYKDKKLQVENVGRSILLVENPTNVVPYERFILLNWDLNADAATNTGPEPWDTLPWEVKTADPKPDYVTIERGSCDLNAWSRTNRWVHREVLKTMSKITGHEILPEFEKAKRPIIEFIKDLELYNSGIKWLTNIRAVVGCMDPIEELRQPTNCQKQKGYADIISKPRDLLVDGVTLNSDDLIIFLFNNPVVVLYPWDGDGNLDLVNDPWDTLSWDGEPTGEDAADFVWRVSIVDEKINLLKEYTATAGDIVIVLDGAIYKGRTYFYNGSGWQRASSEKISDKETPKFSLYDCSGTPLSDETLYPGSSFAGSEIFSYQIDEESNTLDSILGIPLTFKGLGQITDIVFEHDLETQRYNYIQNSTLTEIPGYYYFNVLNADKICNYSPKLKTTWWPSGKTKQRVIDRYVVKNITQLSYDLSVLPHNNDVIVKINGLMQEPNVDYHVVNDSVEILTALNLNDVIECYTYSVEYSVDVITITNVNTTILELSTIPDYSSIDIKIVGSSTGIINDFIVNKNKIILNKSILPLTIGETITVTYISSVNLPETARGYYEMPRSIQNNPTNEEITLYSYNDYVNHFLSIIENQSPDISGLLGKDNSYRDSPKNLSLGEFITQNESSLLKSMFITTDDSVDIIESLRLASREYVRFKNKYIKTAYEMFRNGELTEILDPDNNILLDKWINDVLDRISKTTEVYNTFLYSYMIASGTVYFEEIVNLANGIDDGFGNVTIELNNYIDITDIRNSMYIFTQNINATPLYSGEDLLVEGVDYEIIDTQNPISIRFGPTISLDSTITTIYVRLYNNPIARNIPSTPSKLGLWKTYRPRIESDNTQATPLKNMSPSYIIGHDGSRTPIYGDIRDVFLLELEKRIYNSICSEFKNDYIPPIDWADVYPGKFRNTNWTIEEVSSIIYPSFNKWANKNKLNWRINDTFDIDDEWTFNYRNFGINESFTPGYWRGIYNFYYDTDRPHTHPWEMLGFPNKPSWWDDEYGLDYSSNNTTMWNDLEAGIIKSGARAGIDTKYIRNGLVSSYLPVDSSGKLLTPFEIGLVFDPSLILDDNKDRDWIFGDGSPGVSSWMDTSEYRFTIIEALFLTKPAKFSNLFWDIKDNMRSIADPAQFVSSKTCKRHKLIDQYVHGEEQGGETQIRLGYQQWISDRILFLRRNILEEFGKKIRSLNVKLAHKMGGYINQDSVRLYSESVSPTSTSNSLLIPFKNINIKIFTGEPFDTIVYSGVVIRALSNGKYQVYGYDLVDSIFKIHPASTSSRQIEINVGGTDQSFRYFEIQKNYSLGEVVRYNTVYYRCIKEHFATTFDDNNWTKLSKLPSNGGVEATYKPDRLLSEIVEYAYGHEFNTVQDVFDFLIGYGSYLTSKGWVFDIVDTNTNTIKDWLEAAKQYLFWVATAWAPNTIITLSPMAEKIKLQLKHGHVSNVEKTTNGIYSILNEEGVVVDPSLTVINRKEVVLSNGNDVVSELEVIPKLNDIKLYYLRVSVIENEHIITIENFTDFGDVIFDPVLGLRQNRLELNTYRTLSWVGKYEAPGYIINDRGMVPNIENTIESIRRYHDTESLLDLSRVEDLAKHLNGYEEKKYLVDLQLDDDVQYQFYQGAIREKGTNESIKKLLRSVYVRRDQEISTFEEWAIRVSKFGGVCTNPRIDLLIKANNIKTDPQIVVLDSSKSRTGYVKEIIVLDSEVLYKDVPSVIIVKDPRDPGYGGGASAIAVLNDDNTLNRIDVISPGCGYILEPLVFINRSGWDDPTEPWDTIAWDGSSLDRAISILQKDIVSDSLEDDLIVIDIDDNERWLHRPRTCGLQDLWPTTKKYTYNVPNAGYVHPADVDYSAFDITSFVNMWSIDGSSKPIIHQTIDYDLDTNTYIWNTEKRDTIWISKSNNGEWNVFRAIDIGGDYGVDFTLVTIDGATYLETSTSLPENEDDSRFITSYIVLNIKIVTNTNPVITTIENILYKIENTGVSGETFENQYELYSVDGTLLTLDDETIELYNNDLNYNINIWMYAGMRFKTFDERKNTEATDFFVGEYTWIDDNGNGLWTTQELTSDPGLWITLTVNDEINGIISTIPRLQEPLIDTHLIKQAFIYDAENEKTIFMLPVYDPFKGLFVGPVDQNIDFITDIDPTKYTNSADVNNINPNMVFTKDQVGKLWWDTSTISYLYYEQGSIRERRDNWGRLFEGSIVTVYEWTRSLNPPSSYSGEGTVKNTSDYVQILEYDEFTETERYFYYFWVSGKTTIPNNLKNRTLSCVSLEALIRNPRKQNYQWFSPIAYNKYSNRLESVVETYTWDTNVIIELSARYFEDVKIYINDVELLYGRDFNIPPCSKIISFVKNSPNYPLTGQSIRIEYKKYITVDHRNSFIFNNVNRNIVNRDTVFQINWKYSHSDINTHGEWYLMRENDPRSLILDQHWNKMIDSLMGQTDIIKWNQDVSGFYNLGDGTGFLLVPDPNLSEAEKYGTEYRPRQTWFRNLVLARKIFISKINELLKNICIRDEFTTFEDNFGSSGSESWTWVDWFADGWDSISANPVRQVNNTGELQALTNLNDGDIIKVVEKNNQDDLFTLYQYIEESDSFSSPISREKCTIQLNDIFFNDPTSVTRNIEMRKLITFIQNNIFVEKYRINKNILFFTMLNFSLSEDINSDWVFKTTYLLLNQSGLDLVQSKTFVPDPTSSTLEYIQNIKPYRCKIRDYSVSRNAGFDNIPLLVEDFVNKKIILKYNRVACSGWDIFAWEFSSWDSEFSDVESWGCISEDYIRDAGAFTSIIQNYYTASSPNAELEERFEQIEPDQLVTGDGSFYTVELNFTPIVNELSPFIFVDNKQVFNFTYDMVTNSVTFDVPPGVGAIIEIYNILPFDANGFLQPHIRSSVPEELVPVLGREDLIVNVTRTPQSCISRDGFGEIYWIADSGLDLESIAVSVGGVSINASNIEIIEHSWDDPQYLWDELNQCSGPPWDSEYGIKINEITLSGLKIDFNYTHLLNNASPEFKFRLHRDAYGMQEIYRLCDSNSATLKYDLLHNDSQIIIENIRILGIDNLVSINNPGVIWVGNELIAYHEYENTGSDIILKNLIRGYKNTITIEHHSVGTPVYDAGNVHIMQNINQYEPAKTKDLSISQFKFLQNCG